MRIVAGVARGRRIGAPTGLDTRPTTDRVREALFNALGSLGAVAGSTVVDLFAGSGALGLEALSRGAARVRFVEHDRRARAAIEANLESLGFADRAEVVPSDAFAYLGHALPADLMLCDPPYRFDRWDELLEASAAPLVVCESDRGVAAPPGWELVRQKRYGATVVTILSRSAPHPPE
ncbi:MAG: 16S rRNA (guanine(966)-N(2))-methyltransferase RsmD [Acidimicrobiales bacterium]|nr:16S rRNA (guanine(966)-N(2))-methyltransferase RsmD [Acidimicrobiales bacterium]